ncbi:MAG: hypothetical protein ACI97A_002989 [Planctomycetota bacterium]|jgi:hypothetical protein
MIAVVFAVSLAVMAGLKMMPGIDSGSWGNYSVLMGVVAIMTTGVSYLFARHQTNKLTFNSNPHSVALILKAVNHVTGNLMNQIQFIKEQINDEGGLSENSATQINDAITEAQVGLAALNGVQDNADEKAYSDVYPK